MKVTCNKLLEAPLINMIKTYDSLNVKGVVGILTPGSKQSVQNTSIGALALLSYCNELAVTESLNQRLKIITIKIEKGPINYYNIANASGGILEVPSGLSSEPFAMATNDFEFNIIVGETTVDSTLKEEDVYTYVTENNQTGLEFTGVPMPLMSKNLVQFKVSSTDGVSTIHCDGVSDTVIKDLFSSLKVE